MAMNEADTSLSQALLDLQCVCRGLVFIAEIPLRAKIQARKRKKRESVERWKAKNPLNPELRRQEWDRTNYPCKEAYQRCINGKIQLLLTHDKVTWRWYEDGIKDQYHGFPSLETALKKTTL